jgi:hypothetical protein
MTPTTNTAKTTPAAPTAEKAQTPMTRDEVKQMLRDAAFVLQMTRRVKAEMLADRPESAKKAAGRKTSEMAAGLGV